MLLGPGLVAGPVSQSCLGWRTPRPAGPVGGQAVVSSPGTHLSLLPRGQADTDNTSAWTCPAPRSPVLTPTPPDGKPWQSTPNPLVRRQERRPSQPLIQTVSAHPKLTTWFPVPATSSGLSVSPRSTGANLSPRRWCQEAGPSGGHQTLRVEPLGEAASLRRRSLRTPLSPPGQRDRSATGSPATWAPGLRRPASGLQGGHPSGGRVAQPAAFCVGHPSSRQSLPFPSFPGELSEPSEQRLRWFVQRFQCQWVGFSAHPLLLTAASLGPPPHPIHPGSPCRATSPSARPRLPLDTQRGQRPQRPEGKWWSAWALGMQGRLCPRPSGAVKHRLSALQLRRDKRKRGFRSGTVGS